MAPVALGRRRRMTPDLNLLVAAFRPDHTYHETASDWLSKTGRDSAEGSESLTLLPARDFTLLRATN
ncbi:MAG: hypothetical protein LJE70_07720 [Chromatiaceae bacterium]|nr:hypothetical protein [Chromatiaceae bacterium]